MNNDTPFTAIGDEPIEARIVAWVLGEASAFEAAELERLCAERPELLVFRRRMIALHGLLIEAESAQPDDGWKLPTEKRKPLAEISGQEKIVSIDEAKEKRIRRAGLKAFFAIAACVVLAIVVLQLVHPIWIRQTIISPAEKKSFFMASGDGGVMVHEEAEFSSDAAAQVVDKSASMPLTTTLPPERIEGTPKPIIVPNLETPVNGPAGLSPMVDAKKKSEQTAPSPAEPAADEKSELALNDSAAPVASRSSRPRIIAPPAEKRVFAQGEKVVMDIDAPKDAFAEMDSYSSLSGRESAGAGSGLGSGLGGAGAGGGNIDSQSEADSLGGKGSRQDARATVARASRPEPSSANSLDGKVPTFGDVPEVGFTGELAENGKDSPHKIPTFGDVPVVGKLFSESSEKQKESQPPQITTRSGDFEGTVNYGAPIAGEAGKAEPSSPAPTRTNPALTYEQTQNVDDVRRSLYKAEGNLNLGKYDDAKKEYENTLRTDPHNQAARRGLEKVAAAKSSYYRAAYDHTRAELLAEVDKAWELSVPADKEGKKADVEIVRESKPQMKPETPTAPTDGPAKADAYWDTSKVAQSGKHTGGVEYELHTGYSSQYLFRGMDLSDSNSLRKAIRDQEDKVDERRKLLATIVNTKDILYKGVDQNQGARSAEEEAAVKRGLNTQDYVDAKREFEKDQALLQQLKLKLESSTKTPEPEKPKIDLTKLMEEISAAEDPYSTFSLNISDASFKVAQAALAKGERPDPAGIKVEQFYNAVDYGDPSPQNGQPVAVNIEQSAHPVIPGRNLVRVALKTAAAGRSASQPLRLTLLVDQSGSMVREDRRAAMDKALASLSGLLTKDDRVTVIGFARTPRLLAGGMTGDQAGKLKDLVNQAANEGGTNLELAMNVAATKAMEYKMAGAQNRIVLFTDGAANLGDADPARLAEKVKSLRQSGIAFDIAGIAADELNDDLLGELARNGNGRYYVVGKGDDQDLGKQLAGAFRPAAENVKVQVHFNPERVARYKLIGFEKDRLKTEDFRNDAVDAAELAAEEAGVAIYQVETLPGGSGEIGEVSVRFRDTAAGQMVERTWAIPHDAKAPAIDRATPSMQLAVLSMLAAEKLKGGPLAEAIDFKQLVDPRANVRRFYGSTGRAAEMLQVIDAIK